MNSAVAPVPISIRPAQKSRLRRRSICILFRLDPGLGHDAMPFVHLALDEAAELGRAHLLDRGAFLFELLLDLRHVLNLLQRLVQSRDDRWWSSGRRKQAPP